MTAQQSANEGASPPTPFWPAHIVDLFAYVVVLNLVAEYVPVVITESFTMSLFTALMLKVALELVNLVKDWAKKRFKTAPRLIGRAGSLLILWLVLIGSKFVVLELIAIIFGDRVSLGGFWSVTGLILVLMLCRAGVRRLLEAAK